MNIGRQLKHYRILRELTLEQLGNLINYEKHTIHNWENDKRTPNIGAIQLLATALDVSVIQLLKREEGIDNMAHIEGLRFIGEKFLEEMEDGISPKVMEWFEKLEQSVLEAGYPAMLNETYGFLQIDEYWHGKMNDIEFTMIGEWQEQNPHVTDEGLLKHLQETADILRNLEPGLEVFVGDKTGPLDAHEFSIFFPYGTSNKRIKEILDSYEYAGKVAERTTGLGVNSDTRNDM